VGTCDRADDGQAQPEPAVVPDALRAESLERPGQPVDLTRRDHRPAVADLLAAGAPASLEELVLGYLAVRP
jgi:hypothetical protein